MSQKKKVIEKPNEYLRRYREAYANFVRALAKKEVEANQQAQKPTG